MAVWESFDPAAPPAQAVLYARLRRSGPAVLAVGLHAAGLAALIWLTASPDFTETPRRVLNVELVSALPAPEVQPEAQPEAPLVPALQTAAQAEAAALLEPPINEAASEPAPRPADAAAEPAQRVQDEGSGGAALPDIDSPDAVVLDAPGGAAGETAFATRSSALRGLACARAFGADRDQVGCEGEPSADFARYADGEGVAGIEALMQARFNTLAGLYGAGLDPSLRRLPGQQGMQVMTHQRMGLSGADEMRDTLPPMVPDPAFGD